MIADFLSPAFLQAACAHPHKKVNEIRIFFTSAVSSMPVFVSCVGEIEVQYYEDGVLKTKTFTDLEEAQLGGVTADVHSYVTIYGNVTYINVAGPPASAVGDVDLKDCTTLTYISLYCSNLNKLVMPDDDAAVNNCSIEADNLFELHCRSDRSLIASSMASAIAYSDNNNGYLYTNDDGAYYDTIANAATAKGWNIITSNDQ